MNKFHKVYRKTERFYGTQRVLFSWWIVLILMLQGVSQIPSWFSPEVQPPGLESGLAWVPPLMVLFAGPWIGCPVLIHALLLLSALPHQVFSPFDMDWALRNPIYCLALAFVWVHTTRIALEEPRNRNSILSDGMILFPAMLSFYLFPWLVELGSSSLVEQWVMFSITVFGLGAFFLFRTFSGKRNGVSREMGEKWSRN